MLTKTSFKPGLRFLLVLSLVTAFLPLDAAAAQSGRKIPRKQPESRETPPSPPSKSGPEAEAPAASSPAPDATPVLIAPDGMGPSMIPIMMGVVRDGILDRLREVKAVAARSSGREMNRKEASEAAKGSNNQFVLWFEIASEGPMSSQPSAESLYVNFVVYQPGTGKQKSSGHVYQREVRLGGIGLPAPGTRTTSGTLEYSMYYAGRETANRLLSALGLEELQKFPR
jgi:hypothetical protein